MRTETSTLRSWPRAWGSMLILAASGCISTAAIHDQLRRESAPHLTCPADQIQIADYQTGMAGNYPSTWRAIGCERAFRCSMWVPAAGSGGTSRVECNEDQESEELTLTKVVIDRLSLESGCPAERITIERAGDWRRGSERAYRLRACGQSYVCTTAAGRTDCERAAEGSPVAPTPPAAPTPAASPSPPGPAVSTENKPCSIDTDCSPGLLCVGSGSARTCRPPR